MAMVPGDRGDRGSRDPFGGDHGDRGTPSKLIRGILRPVRPKGPPLRFQFNPPDMPRSGGGGGWLAVPRPRRVDGFEWTGRSPKRYTFVVTFDRYERGRSVEDLCRQLEAMFEPRAPRKPPPILEFSYGPVGRGLWIMEALEPTTGVELRNEQLRRLRAEFTVTLTEYDDVGAAFKSPAQRHNDRDDDDGGGGGGKGGNRTTTARAGDTLARIAASELGDASRWTELADLNGIRDPNGVVVGQSIRIPSG